MSRAYAQAEHARTEAEARAMQVRCCVAGCYSPEWHDREAPRCDDCDAPCCTGHLTDNLTRTRVDGGSEPRVIWHQCPACVESQRIEDKAQAVLDKVAILAAVIEIGTLVAGCADISRDELYSQLQGISIRLQVAA
jgi:hypothetical protein